ncbi:OmpA family protein [Lutibacter sp. A64]|uniref:OmpA family protein n=1 Tax=Lutibacter sp. A64 TaxID=2918526 RepID=UPI001F05E485|nr:OmpA family protein [Lutibacter sp. A64]UMB52587.1 OmpA family protein [Lutibacter sp. A64]
MKNIIIVIFISISTIGFSQEKYKLADTFFEKMQYLEAAKEYEAAINNGDNSKDVLKKIGDAYYFNTSMKSANKWYGKLITLYEEDLEAEYFFRYSKSFQGMEKYSAAKKWMKVFVAKSKKDVLNSNLNTDTTSKHILDQEPQFILSNLSINTVFSDFAPMYYNNKLVYASEIDSSYSQTSNYKINKPLYFNLYLGDINYENKDVIMEGDFSKVLNSKYHEATLSFSSDFKKVYYTRNNYVGNGANDGKINRLKLYSATLVEGADGKKDWENIKELPFNSKEYSVGHPALSADGTKLYFVSDMPGTIGETDIFVVDILKDDVYSQPKNLGTKINTSGKEMFPFLTENKLYFASDGHIGLGGLDVFESNYSTNTVFETAINLGAPLNSVLDDFGYIVNEETNTGFVCSNRNSGKGDDDIYSFERIEIGVCKQFVEGYISNNLTGEKISNANVSLFSSEGDKLEEIQTDINGNYSFQKEISCNTEFILKVHKNGFDLKEKSFLTTDKSEKISIPIGIDKLNELIVEENGLLKIKVGTIYFDLDKWDIRKDAAFEFDKVVFLLKQYPNMIINIESHTDSRGRDAYNLLLSDKRAKATRDYIISKGIAPNRIIKAKGYGETRLINKCKNRVPCSEMLHQLNRRSEFIILKM